jgi:aryl-alcohol dehydrogenase-like predicted oxidoreductase
VAPRTLCAQKSLIGFVATEGSATNCTYGSAATPLDFQVGHYIGFVPYSPLGRGYLSGTLNEDTKFDSGNDNRATLPRFTAEAMKANRVLVDLLNEFGQRKGATVSQVALAWVLSQKPWIVPIPGTTKLERLEENLRSVDLECTPEEWRDLNHAVSKIKLQGDRYPTDEEKRVGH